MEKKEFKVGEVFTAGLVRLKCVENVWKVIHAIGVYSKNTIIVHVQT